jgi:hypothetical protein
MDQSVAQSIAQKDKPQPRKVVSKQIITPRVKWIGEVPVAGYVADLVIAEANRRKVHPTQLISDIIYYVATAGLWQAVIDPEPLGRRNKD